MGGDFPDDLRYTESDEWIRREGDELVSGITAYAAEQLGDIVYVQLPAAGKHFDKQQSFGEIESVKAVSDLFAPLAAEIVAVNDELDSNPGLINEDPYGRGWMLRLRPDTATDYDSLLTPQAYEQSTKDRH